jgi:hypothetical protein
VSEQITIDIINTVKKAHENIMVVTGVLIGILLIVYFFTFAQFFDRGYMAVVYFQAVTSVMLVVALFFLKRIAFVFIRMIYGRRDAYQPFLSAIVASDLDKDARTLEQEFGSSGMHA